MRNTGAAACLIAAVAVACGSQPDDKELAQIRAELADLRAEQRSLREELRGLSGVGDAGASPASPTAEPPPETPESPESIDIAVDSTPQGADVFVADKKVGVTPLVLPASTAGGDLAVRIEKAGYRPHLLNVRPTAGAKISVQLARKKGR